MKAKTIKILLFLVLSNSIYAQHDVTDSTKQNEVTISGYNKQKALTDIKKGYIKIILPGGIVAATRTFR